MYTYHQDGTLPKNNEIFVFGSNMAGIHGAGAAKAAVQFGALLGVGFGACGMTWAIPTKDEKLNVLPLEEIEIFVEAFKLWIRNNPKRNFFVTRVGCGLAGYSDEQIAPMFRGAMNCSFAEQWKKYLEVS